jgi:hypothetical protein
VRAALCRSTAVQQPRIGQGYISRLQQQQHGAAGSQQQSEAHK